MLSSLFLMAPVISNCFLASCLHEGKKEMTKMKRSIMRICFFRILIFLIKSPWSVSDLLYLSKVSLPLLRTGPSILFFLSCIPSLFPEIYPKPVQSNFLSHPHYCPVPSFVPLQFFLVLHLVSSPVCETISLRLLRSSVSHSQSF